MHSCAIFYLRNHPKHFLSTLLHSCICALNSSIVIMGYAHTHLYALVLICNWLHTVTARWPPGKRCRWAEEQTVVQLWSQQKNLGQHYHKCFLIDSQRPTTIDVPLDVRWRFVFFDNWCGSIFIGQTSENPPTAPWPRSNVSTALLAPCCTYQEILLVPRLKLHGFSVLGNTSKAAAASAAHEAEFCRWKSFWWWHSVTWPY